MTSRLAQSLGRKLFGIGALSLALLTAACGTSAATTTPAGGSTATPASTCNATVADLTPSGAGTSTATKVSITGSKTLNIDGSTALAPLISAAGKTFDTVNGTTTTINPNGSGTGLKDVESGAVQIGLSDVFAIEKASSATGYSDLVDHQVAVVAFTLVVSPDLQGKITNLTSQQVKDIYAGNITNWSSINPSVNEPINVVVRTATSGTRATFKRYVLQDPKTKKDQPATAQTEDTTGELVATVSADKGAIGYTSTGFVLNATQASQIIPICLDGYDASATNINAGNYKFWSYEHAYTKGTPAAGSAADALLTFVNSMPFQTMDLPRLGFLTVGSLSSTATGTHPTPTFGN